MGDCSADGRINGGGGDTVRADALIILLANAGGDGEAMRTGSGGGEAIRSGGGEATRMGFGGGDVILSVADDDTGPVALGDGVEEDTGVGRLVGRGAGGSFGGLRPGAATMDATFVSNSPVSNITGISRTFGSSGSLAGRAEDAADSDFFTFLVETLVDGSTSLTGGTGDATSDFDTAT